MPKPFWRYFGPRRDWFRTAFYNDKRVNWVSQIPQDPDGDGNTDLVARFDADGFLLVDYSKDTARTADFTGSGNLDINRSVAATADFDGTGDLELDYSEYLFRTADFTGSGEMYSPLVFFDGFGTFTALGVVSPGREADFDGTGDLDINYSAGTTRTADFTGDGTFALDPSEFDTTLDWVGIGDWDLATGINRAADFDGTGDLDVDYDQDVSFESSFAMTAGGAATPILEDSPPAGVSGMIAWFDPSIRSTHYWDTAGTEIVSDGDHLEYVDDISGNANDLTSGADEAYWVANGINDLGSWDHRAFGTSPMSANTGWAEADDLTEMTWFIVLQGGFDFDAYVGRFSTVNYNFSGGLLEITNSGYDWSTSSTLDLTDTFQSYPRVITTTWDFVTSSAVLRENGVEIDTDTGPDLTPLGDFTSTQLGLGGGLTGEIIIFDSVLSAGDITAIEDYLIDKWIPDELFDIPTWTGVGSWDLDETFTPLPGGGGGGEASMTWGGVGGWDLGVDLANETSADWDGAANWDLDTNLIEGFEDPSDVPNLELWLDAMDNSTVLDAGASPASHLDPVDTWEDKSGNGYDLIQDTAPNRPVYFDPGLSPQKWIYFDTDSQRFLERTAASTGFDTDEWTLFITMILPGANTSYTGGIFDTNSNPQDGSIQVRYTYTIGAALGGAVDGDVAMVLRGVTVSVSTATRATLYVDSNDDFYMDTTQGDTVLIPAFDGKADATNVDNLSLKVGRSFGESQSVGDAYVGEILFYSRTLTSGERNDVELYLDAKWSI